MTNFDSNVFDLITSLIDFVNICYKITFRFKGKQRFSIILLGHQKQIWRGGGGGGGGRGSVARELLQVSGSNGTPF